MKPEIDLIDLLAKSAIKDGLDADLIEVVEFIDHEENRDALRKAILLRFGGLNENQLDEIAGKKYLVPMAKKIADRMREID